MQHVERLPWRTSGCVSTTALGRRPVTALHPGGGIAATRLVDLRRLMSEMNLPDRELQSPDADWGVARMSGFSRNTLSVSQAAGGTAARDLCFRRRAPLCLAGEDPEPMDDRRAASGYSAPQAAGCRGGRPRPLWVVPSRRAAFTSGKPTSLAERPRRPDGRPDRTPTWPGVGRTTGPIETKALNDFVPNPEARPRKSATA